MFKKVFIWVLGLAVGLSLPASAELVGWWTFNDGSGSVAVDSSDNGNDGTLEP